MSLLYSISDPVLEDKEKLEEEFLSFLHDLNYPGDSIFRGPSFRLGGGRTLENFYAWCLRVWHGRSAETPFPCYADLAILDLASCQYVCLIEFRLQLDAQIKLKLATVFQSVLDCAQTRPPVFLVAPAHGAGFRIYQLRDHGNWREIPKRHFPHYPTLTAGLASEKTLAGEIRSARSFRRFSLACHGLTLAIVLIIAANLIGLAHLTVSQITLIVLACALVVAPQAMGFRLRDGAAKSNSSKAR